MRLEMHLFTLPTVNFYDHFIRAGPVVCAGTANKSGWMTEKEFGQFLNH